ncbi:MAG TPA: nickel insertion protein, partial [Planctomycetota bacterium]|nr:nickel insertion protein [Planctomycetota bacterium]
MRIGYLDCFSGVAGDMWVGALLDLGLPLARLEAAVRTLALPGVSLRAERVLRCGITGTHFTVVLGGAGETGVKFQPVSPLRAPASAAATSHSHRRLADVRAILARADLPAPVRAQCDAVFVAIAAAESLQHASSADEVHFHEVGAEDTITDVV